MSENMAGGKKFIRISPLKKIANFYRVNSFINFVQIIKRVTITNSNRFIPENMAVGKNSIRVSP